MRVVVAIALLATAGCGNGATPAADLGAPIDGDLAADPGIDDGGVPAPGSSFHRIIAGSFSFAAPPTADLLLLDQPAAGSDVLAYTPGGTLLHSFGSVTVRAVYGNRAAAIVDGAQLFYWWPGGTSPPVSSQPMTPETSAISPDGLYIAAYGPFGDGGNVLVAGARDQLAVAADVGVVVALAFSPVGHHLYVVARQPTSSSRFDLYRLANGSASSTPVRVASDVAADLAFSADGQSLAVALLAASGPGTLTVAPTTFDVDDAINTSGTRAPAADVDVAVTRPCPLFVPQRSVVAYAGVVSGAAAARTFDFATAATQTLMPTPTNVCADTATTAWIGYDDGSTLWGLASGSWFSPPGLVGTVVADHLGSGVFAVEYSSQTINTYGVFGGDFAHRYDCGRGHYGTGALIDDARSVILTGPFDATGPELDLCSASGTTSLVSTPVRGFAYEPIGRTLYYILDDGVYAGPL